jgi:hypothetical protein
VFVATLHRLFVSGSDRYCVDWMQSLNVLDPYTWLNDVLERIVSEKVKINELDSLLAWNWHSANEPVKALAA